MKPDIDLTQNNVFSSNNNFESSVNKSRRKTLPWRKDKINLSNKYTYNFSTINEYLYFDQLYFAYLNSSNNQHRRLPWRSEMYSGIKFKHISNNDQYKQPPWKSESQKLLINLDNTGKLKHAKYYLYPERYKGYAFCISSKLRRKIKRTKNRKYIVWRYSFDPEYYDIYYDTNNRKDHYVYYKNRELKRREEPWQPKGRIPQEYDALFDNTDWRDLLKARIGLLDREFLLKEKEKEEERLFINDFISMHQSITTYTFTTNYNHTDFRTYTITDLDLNTF